MTYSANTPFKTRKLFQLWDQLLVDNGILLRRFLNTDTQQTYKQLIVPKCLQAEILDQLHSGVVGGHLGKAKTLGKLKSQYYCPGHYQDVQNHCNTCPTCATRKTPAPQARGPLQNITVSSPMQMVGVDLLGPIPQSHTGNMYLLVTMDYFTKWGEAYPITNMEAATVANMLTNEIFFRFSPPNESTPIRGGNLSLNCSKKYVEYYKYIYMYYATYHPQCDGLIERYNRTLLDMLAIASKGNPNDWEKFVRPLCFAYNTSIQASTGYTPYYLMYGHEARLPIDLQFGTSFSDILSDRQFQTMSKKIILIHQHAMFIGIQFELVVHPIGYIPISLHNTGCILFSKKGAM